MQVYDEIVESVRTIRQWIDGPQLQQLSDDETYWPVPPNMGKGHISVIRLRPGMVMAFADMAIEDTISGEYNYINRHSISFTYCTVGELSLLTHSQDNPYYSCRGGYEILSAFPEGTGRPVAPSSDVYKCVTIYLAPSLFFDFFPGMEDLVHPDLLNVARGDKKQLFYQELPATANVHMAMRDILTCPYKGPHRRLLMESKAMELMTHTLWRSQPISLADQTGGLRVGDVERVNNAKKIMDMDFREDIKLLHLARKVGLPHTKLNLYFRQIYGTTVFGYLRELRMNEARFLLSKGDANVTEAAYAVGYSSLSHFAKVFKKYCGQAPGDFMRHASGRM